MDYSQKSRYEIRSRTLHHKFAVIYAGTGLQLVPDVFTKMPNPQLLAVIGAACHE
jgi:hypothetical protein